MPTYKVKYSNQRKDGSKIMCTFLKMKTKSYQVGELVVVFSWCCYVVTAVIIIGLEPFSLYILSNPSGGATTTTTRRTT